MGGVRARRALSIVGAGVLAIALVAPAAAQEVGSSRTSWGVAQATWGTFDPDTLVGTLVLVAMEESPDGLYIVYERIHTRAVTCTMGTQTTRDDEPGIVGTVWYGGGVADSATLDVRRLMTARGTGTVDLTGQRVSTCSEAGNDRIGEKSVRISLDLHGAGQARNDRERWADGEHGSWKDALTLALRERPADGVVTVGRHTRTLADGEALIGRITMREHWMYH